MKKYFFLLLTIGLLTSCSKDEENPTNTTSTELTGKWKLIEVYLDPGDGSGTFEPVESEKRIIFHEDGTITSNGDLCRMSNEADNPTSGTYSLSDSTFTSADCDNPDYSYEFEQSDDILIITYPCIEPCQMKFEKE